MSSKVVNSVKNGKEVLTKLKDLKLPDINIQNELKSLHPHQKYLVKKYERLNKDRFSHFHRNHILYGRTRGIALGVWAFSIYLYTVYTMKQERFLDELPDDLPPAETNETPAVSESSYPPKALPTS